jgi:DNA-directed RNA polymerase specialized sigma24 family protein
MFAQAQRRRPMADLDEHLPGIQAGDPESFARWLGGAEASVRLGLRSFAAQVDTEAVLQEALLRVWQVAPRFVPDGRPNGLLRLAARIARNLAISETRRPAPALPPPSEEPVVVAADPLLRRAIETCREELPPKPAQALDARVASGGALPVETLAEGLAMRLNTFLQNVTRARKLLADCLRRRGIDLGQELAR